MVRIGPTAQKRLEAVTAAKKRYDDKLRELDAEYKFRKYELRLPVVETVEDALTEGVPARQVALKGLGFNDVGSLKAFRRASLGANIAIATAGEALPVQPVKVGPIIVGDFDAEDRSLKVTDTTGTEYMLTSIPYGDDGAPTEAFYGDMADSPDAREIQRMVSEKYPSIYDWNE